jgi:hypothetical protein
MVATTCVHCAKVARISYFPRRGQWTDPLFGWLSIGLHQWLSGNQQTIVTVVDELDGLFRAQEPDGTSVKWKIGLCENCRRPLFLVLDEAEQRVVRTFPPVSLERPPHVPEGVADDFVEARLCLSVGAYKATAAMCRRALQAAALQKGAGKGELVAQIDKLVEKGALNSSLAEAAHQVRYFGNYGAHPDADGLGDVSEGEAESICDLTWQVLEGLYVNPARVAAVKAALVGRKAGAPVAVQTAAEQQEPPVEEQP